jgi:hypothetical protein
MSGIPAMGVASLSKPIREERPAARITVCTRAGFTGPDFDERR